MTDRHEQPEDPWLFSDGKAVTIVCPARPAAQVVALPDSENSNLYAYADVDALVELYGHIRATNPMTPVKWLKSSDFHLDSPDYYTTHLVLLGGVNWNSVVAHVVRKREVALPVIQKSKNYRNTEYRVLKEHGRARRFRATWDESGRLVTDVGYFARIPNPFNTRRTLTLCNAVDSRGVLGVVRSLTDERFRDRNARRMASKSERGSYSLLMRIRVVGASAVTPDWTDPSVRLHEWSPEIA